MTAAAAPLPAEVGSLHSAAAAIAASRVLGLDGQPVRLRDAIGSRTTVVALVRQFGCLFCHELVAELVAAAPTFEQRGAQVLIIGCGSVEQASRFAKHKGLPRPGVRLFADPDRESYETAQLPRSYLRTFFHPGAMEAYGRARREGHRIVGAFGDVPQLGGVFVIRPPAELLFEQRSRFAGDHPSMEALLDVVSRTGRA